MDCRLGWQTLTAAAPTPSPRSILTLQIPDRYRLLLTDGLNTQDRWYTTQSSIDAREQRTCDNIKAAGITLYTVQVNHRERSDLDASAAGLRQRCWQVLPADPGRTDRHDLWPDRHVTLKLRLAM